MNSTNNKMRLLGELSDERGEGNFNEAFEFVMMVDTEQIFTAKIIHTKTGCSIYGTPSKDKNGAIDDVCEQMYMHLTNPTDNDADNDILKKNFKRECCKIKCIITKLEKAKAEVETLEGDYGDFLAHEMFCKLIKSYQIKYEYFCALLTGGDVHN